MLNEWHWDLRVQLEEAHKGAAEKNRSTKQVKLQQSTLRASTSTLRFLGFVFHFCFLFSVQGLHIQFHTKKRPQIKFFRNNWYIFKCFKF